MSKCEPLLSICIPTFNRAEIISQTVEHLLSLEEFDDDVELVIADNASSDDTENKIFELKCRFNNKRIIYKKNESNIKDRNFYTALSLGTGKYLKLFNDYTYFNNDILFYIKNYLRGSENLDLNVFFYNHLRIENIKIGDCIYVNSLDDFQKNVNNKVTWISNFGCWKKDLKKLEPYNCNSASQLLQMEWTLHLVDIIKTTQIVNLSYKCFNIVLGKRTSYNFFIPHVVNYYNILADYNNQGKIHKRTILYDKKRVLSDFVGNKIIEFLLLNKSNDFELDGSWRIVFRHFYNIPYFYKLLIIGFLKKIKRVLFR